MRGRRQYGLREGGGGGEKRLGREVVKEETGKVVTGEKASWNEENGWKDERKWVDELKGEEEHMKHCNGRKR